MSGLEILGFVASVVSISQMASELCHHIRRTKYIYDRIDSIDVGGVKDIGRMAKDIEKILKDVEKTTRDSYAVHCLGDSTHLTSRSCQSMKMFPLKEIHCQFNGLYCEMQHYNQKRSPKICFSRRGLIHLAKRLSNIMKRILFILNEVLLGLAMPATALWLNNCLYIWMPSATSERIIQDATNYIPPSLATFLIPPSRPSAFRPIVLFTILTLAFSFRMVGFATMMVSKRRTYLTLAAIFGALFIGAQAGMTPEEEFLVVLPAISSLAYLATIIHQYMIPKVVYNPCPCKTSNSQKQVLQGITIPIREHREEFSGTGISSTDLSFSCGTENYSREKFNIQLDKA